ncbi:major facilitator superfamily domain-containing protein [Dactylonectria estremocensis]|uniref:Major facilitator superfamily domain-containing protein n=1 Tax=Dactylonectria estremocensis TaxID=1079267 RepID=A0A9P9EGU9_9HYPO|nr:major facilitator superfamily domain-containing protein [Dactylonectria estremocensis]
MSSFGILQSRHLEHVPGTVILEADPELDNITTAFKHGEGKFANVILVPQPSTDPNDPLNYSATKKMAVLSICCFGGILFAATTGPLLNAALALLVVEFEVSFTQVTKYVTGYQLLVVGITGPVVSACSRKWGRRPVFLVSSIFGLIGSVVGSVTTSINGLLAARIIQGFSTSAYESVILTIIGDMFFVHQRGFAASLVQFFIGTLTNLCTMIAGVIATHLNWRYCFYLMAMCSGLQLILLFLFVPETSFIRTNGTEANQLNEAADVKNAHAAHVENAAAASPLHTTDTTSSSTPAPPKKTYLQELAVFTGTHSDESFFHLLLAPFASCLNLAVLWVILLGGGYAAFTIAPLYVMSQIFSAPPYNLSAEGVGFLNIGPLIGGILATVLLSLVNDPIIGWASRKNHGIYEPEFRLLILLLGCLTGPGVIAFGYLAENGDSYYATSACHGVAMFGVTVVAVLTSNYILDAFRNLSNEVFISSMMFKNFLLFGMSYFINDVVAENGPQYTFKWFGGTALVMMLTVPVVFVLGKVYRSYWHRHNIIEKLGLMTHSEL